MEVQIELVKELSLIIVVVASFSLKEAGFETIMINCNPETVSTDYDTSDRLYFEPLIEEYVQHIILKENQRYLLGVIAQFGGQTPIKLAKFFTIIHYQFLEPNTHQSTLQRIEIDLETY